MIKEEVLEKVLERDKPSRFNPWLKNHWGVGCNAGWEFLGTSLEHVIQ